MPELAISMDVRRVSDAAAVIDIKGDVTAACEGVLMEAYNQTGDEKTKAIILNFSGLEYMNSGGIGLLVTLLVRVNRQKQSLLAFGLNDHYRQIFELTRLDDAIGIHKTEAEALGAGAA